MNWFCTTKTAYHLEEKFDIYQMAAPWTKHHDRLLYQLHPYVLDIFPKYPSYSGHYDEIKKQGLYSTNQTPHICAVYKKHFSLCFLY